MNSTFLPNRLSWRGKELNKICPPKQTRRPLPLLLSPSFFYDAMTPFYKFQGEMLFNCILKKIFFHDRKSIHWEKEYWRKNTFWVENNCPAFWTNTKGPHPYGLFGISETTHTIWTKYIFYKTECLLFEDNFCTRKYFVLDIYLYSLRD